MRLRSTPSVPVGDTGIFIFHDKFIGTEPESGGMESPIVRGSVL